MNRKWRGTAFADFRRFGPCLFGVSFTFPGGFLCFFYWAVLKGSSHSSVLLYAIRHGFTWTLNVVGSSSHFGNHHQKIWVPLRSFHVPLPLDRSLFIGMSPRIESIIRCSLAHFQPGLNKSGAFTRRAQPNNLTRNDVLQGRLLNPRVK